mmetsp:Transcript_42188/g.78470  ORF Transcript_42188/g.78470 Transcript_42188/m.78470 type:complete len:212 (-) Transcript_42188:159-794(-)
MARELRDALLKAGVSDDQAEVVLQNMAETRDDAVPVEGYVLPVEQRTVVVQHGATALGIHTGCCGRHVLSPVCLAMLGRVAQLSQEDISDLQRIVNTEYFWIFWMQVASCLFLLAVFLFGIALDSISSDPSDGIEIKGWMTVSRVVASWFFVLLMIGAYFLRCWAHPAICEKLQQRFSSRGMSFHIVPRCTINCVPVAWRLIVSYQTTTEV